MMSMTRGTVWSGKNGRVYRTRPGCAPEQVGDGPSDAQWERIAASIAFRRRGLPPTLAVDESHAG